MKINSNVLIKNLMEWNGMLMKCNEILNIKCKYELLYAMNCKNK